MSLTSGDSGPSAGTWDFSVCISPAQGAFQSLHSSIPVPSPPDLSNAPPHSLARTLPQPDTPAPPTPTFPPDTPMEGKKPSLIPFLLPALGSDMLVIPVWDGQRDNTWHGATLSLQNSQSCFRQPLCPHCVSTLAPELLALAVSPSPRMR